MRNKLIAAGAGLFGYGLLWGWAITGDKLEQKAKRNQLLLADIIDRKNRELTGARRLLVKKEESEAEESFKELTGASAEEIRAKSEDYVATLEAKKTQEDIDEAARKALEAVHKHDGDPDTGGPVEPEDSPTEAPAFPDGETPQETRRNLQSVIEQYTSNKDEVHDFESMVLANAEVEDVPPFVISRESFQFDPEEGDEYTKTTLTYYERERVLVDEDLDIIEYPDAVVGFRNLAQFGGESGDPDVVFIRNRKLQTDFEVDRETDVPPPAHIIYGMDRETFEVQKAAGTLRFRPEDE